MKKQSLAVTARWVEQVRREFGAESVGSSLPNMPVWLRWLVRCFPQLAREVVFRTGKIDAEIDALIRQGFVFQVIELGAGYSQRGHHFVTKYPDLVYVETDLPEIIYAKRPALDLTKPSHVLRVFDVLSDDILLLHEYIRKPKTAVVAEGLMLYLSKQELFRLLENIERFLRSVGGGFLIFDAIHWEDETLVIRWMRKVLVPLLRLEKTPWPNFQDCAEGKNVLEAKGYRMVGYEKRGKINIYTAGVSA